MPDVVSGVSESHGTHSAHHIHLPLIHLPGSKICVSYLAKNCCWEGSITTYASQMEKSFLLLGYEKKTTTFEYDLSIVSTDTCLIKILFPVQHILAAHDSTGPVDQQIQIQPDVKHNVIKWNMKELLHHSVSLSRSVKMTFPVHVQIPQSPFLIPFPFTCHRECGIHRPFFLFPSECQRQGKCHTKNLLQHYNRLPTLPVQPQGALQLWALGRSHLTLWFKIMPEKNRTGYNASYLLAAYVQWKQINCGRPGIGICRLSQG